MTDTELKTLLEVAEKAAEKIRHPDDCDCMAQFNAKFKPYKCAELVREVLRLSKDEACLRELINDLTDTGKCHYDHHGQ